MNKPQNRKLPHWVAALIIVVATAALVGPFFLLPSLPSVSRVGQLSTALSRDPRFSEVHVITTDSGNLVMILAPETFPASDRPDLSRLIRDHLHKDFAVSYGLPHAPETPAP